MQSTNHILWRFVCAYASFGLARKMLISFAYLSMGAKGGKEWDRGADFVVLPHAHAAR